MTTKNKKTAFYTALAKAPGLLKEYIKQYTQGQVDFPDELVEAFTQAQGDVTKIEQMCNNLKKSKEGAQIMKVAEQVYAAAQQEIDAEIQGSTSLFKDGGKFKYLYDMLNKFDPKNNKQQLLTPPSLIPPQELEFSPKLPPSLTPKQELEFDPKVLSTKFKKLK
jgi:hypothetical protein